MSQFEEAQLAAAVDAAVASVVLKRDKKLPYKRQCLTNSWKATTQVETLPVEASNRDTKAAKDFLVIIAIVEPTAKVCASETAVTSNTNMRLKWPSKQAICL